MPKLYASSPVLTNEQVAGILAQYSTKDIAYAIAKSLKYAKLDSAEGLRFLDRKRQEQCKNGHYLTIQNSREWKHPSGYVYLICKVCERERVARHRAKQLRGDV